jgi:hypothetical protein
VAYGEPKQPGRAAEYLGSKKNITGSVLAGGGLVLAFTGIIGFPLWLPVVAALYGIGALVAPSDRAKGGGAGGDAGGNFDRQAVLDSLAALQKDMHGRVPADIEAKVQKITASIQSVLPKAGRLSGGSQHLFVLQRTATDYLPTTVHSYLDLPREYAETHVIDQGKTAHQLVSEQLDVLSAQMNEVVDAANRGDVDALLAQGRFLDEKFGNQALSIEGPPETAAPPQPTVQSAPPPPTEQRQKNPPMSQL